SGALGAADHQPTEASSTDKRPKAGVQGAQRPAGGLRVSPNSSAEQPAGMRSGARQIAKPTESPSTDTRPKAGVQRTHRPAGAAPRHTSTNRVQWEYLPPASFEHPATPPAEDGETPVISWPARSPTNRITLD